MGLLDDIAAGNAAWAATHGNRNLPNLPARNAAILTCMDHRIVPLRLLGLSVGDTHVIRNAGGRASDDAIRSLVISYKMLGTREWFVIHHTRCGMMTFTDEEMRALLRSSLEPAWRDDAGWHDHGGGGSTHGDDIDWLTFADLEQSVTDDVARIRNHPLVPARIPIYGFVYDIDTGKLSEVAAAMVASRPTA
ncbi:MAG: carbonic anhydrase [Proteobacteria bacterium]|nr:carbonic anhydrase [Pseudomonadota bacterium]